MRAGLFHVGCLLRWMAIAVVVAALAGCGPLFRLAYDNAPLGMRIAADEYFDLDTAQMDLLRPALARFHDWHRQQELPLYEKLATGAGERLKRGLTAEDVAWAYDAARARYHAMLARAIDEVAPLAARLGEDNLKALEKKFADNNRKRDRETFAPDERRRIEMRVREMRKRFEPWIGDLNEAQEAKLVEFARTSAMYDAGANAMRRQRQRELVALLREHRASPDIAQRLKRQFIRTEATVDAEEAAQQRAVRASLIRLVVDMDRLLSPGQRKEGVERFARYSDDFAHLAGRAGGGADVATTRGQ